MIILLIVLLLIVTILSLTTITNENKKGEESLEQLKKKVLDCGWNYLDEDVFVKGTFNNGIWQVKKEEGEIIWFVDNLQFSHYLWVLDKKKTFTINYASSIAQFFLTLSHGKDEAKELVHLQTVTIDNQAFNKNFVVLATDSTFVNNILTSETIDLLNSWQDTANNKYLPKIILSKKGLEIKLHQPFLDFSTLNKLVELGESIVKNPMIFVRSNQQ